MKVEYKSRASDCPDGTERRSVYGLTMVETKRAPDVPRGSSRVIRRKSGGKRWTGIVVL